MTGGSTARFWWGWLAATAALYGVFWAILLGLDTEPRPGPLLLLVALVTAVLALVNLNVMGDGPDWEVHADSPVSAPGQDARLAMFARVIGSHLDARHADPGLRDRLATLADERLRQRHALTLQDPRAGDLLGREVHEVLTGPPRALGRAQIENCVRRIEEL